MIFCEVEITSFRHVIVRIASESSPTCRLDAVPKYVLYFTVYSLFADESKGIDIQVAKLSVVRLRGAFGAVTARWSVVGNDTNDLSPLYGTITFTEAQTSAVIQIQSVPDEVRTYKYL